jgi:hypothetical protein
MGQNLTLRRQGAKKKRDVLPPFNLCSFAPLRESLNRVNSYRRRPAAPNERPTAQKGDCLWLLDFSPDQVHRPPLRGPLIRGRPAVAG